MPILNLVVDTEIKDQKAVVLALSKFGAKVLQKPLSYMEVFITYNETLAFGGTFDPAFILKIDCLDTISPYLNEEYSRLFSEFLNDKIGIPKDRGYIGFFDPGRTHLGYNGTTFATIFGAK